MLTAAYSLVNTNANWKNTYDTALLSLRLNQSKYALRALYQMYGGLILLIAVKIVGDLKVAGSGDN